jgi:hypothetical protein
MKPPKWMKLEHVPDERYPNLYTVRLHIAWWYVPILFLVAQFKRLTGRLYKVPDSCDGMKVIDVRFGS